VKIELGGNTVLYINCAKYSGTHFNSIKHVFQCKFLSFCVPVVENMQIDTEVLVCNDDC